ncbi:MAG: pentapeptide repeat-containing protein, partial [Pirellulales bacterium]|nr:pentapeptide repeat-containing protein [Pirellulales bacterium]
MTKYWSALVTASLTTLTAFTLGPVVRADIFQWEYINPADPSQGKQPSTTLCPDGAGAYAGPAANLANRNLTMAYLIGAELPADVVTDFEGNVISYAVADLSGANLSGADAQGAHFYFAKLTGANLSGANLKDVYFWGYPYWAIPTGADLTNANLSGADARGADFGVATLAGANFTGAEVRGANFIFSGLTAAQLYSTASYQAHNLSAIKLSGNYAHLDLAGQNLTNSTFYIATLSGANLSRANLTNADFTSYSTGIADLIGANLSQANLTNVDFRGYEGEDGILPGANLTDANLSGADARGANFDFATLSGANTSNLIQSNGHVSGLDLTVGASLVVRDYDGNPATAPPAGPLPIVVDQHLAMDATSMLKLVFDVDPWDSTIAFTPGIPVARGGTLELAFAPGVDVASQIGRTIKLFDWTGV